MDLKINFDNSYSQLPEDFYESVKPTQVRSPSIIRVNNRLAKELGIDLQDRDSEKLADFFSGNTVLNWSNPIAQVYAGHQFGYFSPRLWDGRSILLGEVIDINGKRRDLQLKWSGVTLFSRNWDWRATLGSVIREYIVSEAMYALNIATTRSLAMVKTWEPVYRENTHPGAVLCRVASSHIRIWTFEYFSWKQDLESLKILADYVITRHYPNLDNNENKYLSLFESVVDIQSQLVARWMNIGFIHGVMNTDNVLISGETMDYGPCAFMDDYNKNTVFSSIDQNGRYSFNNQKYAIEWDLARFWESLIPLISSNSEKSIGFIQNSLKWFQNKFDDYYYSGMNNKVWIFEDNKYDSDLIDELLTLMEKNKLDYTLFFRSLCEIVETEDFNIIKKLCKDNEIDIWLGRWFQIIKKQDINLSQIVIQMKSLNPVFIPRNHRVEEAIHHAVTENDFSFMNTLIEILKNPYTDSLKYKEYMLPPEMKDPSYKTFCGT